MDRPNGRTDGADDADRLAALEVADLVHLSDVYAQIAYDNPRMITEELRRETVRTACSLVGTGMFDIGDLSGPPAFSRPGDIHAPGTFVAWNAIPLDELSHLLSDAYARNLVDSVGWNWMLWLRRVELSESLARREKRRHRLVAAISGLIGSGSRPGPHRKVAHHHPRAHKR